MGEILEVIFEIAIELISELPELFIWLITKTWFWLFTVVGVLIYYIVETQTF